MSIRKFFLIFNRRTHVILITRPDKNGTKNWQAILQRY
ncbi:hypothetical protein LEP1GSC103_0696 [Leptospira borgpetersenii serovar Javanica str. UI 09931]|uniref:Uncharacterized protein n=1 Tax=Leptospira borgpetersenii serovar Javanica str. UI 09931 TaxID=1049767 RepID=A0AAV3J7J5_LEPBO|nr:hypothetical protein LEP1GSC137_0412 [Leptospira borgpetersenii str. Noumea 25]EPG56161.1 hypothetical protein LEP1GSC103_0696 [Leptospira borgpetersenii serovar Javanica str. UI 09931]